MKGPISADKMKELFDALRSAIGKEKVFHEDFICASYSRDLIDYQGTPLVVVIPSDTEEVQAVMKIANQFKVPITPSGSRTSIMDALKCDGWIMLDTTALNKKLEIDEDNLTFTADAGMSVYVIDKELRKRGYCYPTHVANPSPLPIGSDICKDTHGSIGSMLGRVNQHVIGLEVVLGNGEVLNTGSSQVVSGLPKFNRYGLPDLTGLFAASEGGLGIITKVIYPLYPVPVKIKELDFSFGPAISDLENLVKSAQELRRKKVAYTIHHLDPYFLSWAARCLHHGKPNEWGDFPPDLFGHSLVIGVESLISEREYEEKEKAVKAICEQFGGKQVESLESLVEGDGPWEMTAKTFLSMPYRWWLNWAETPYSSAVPYYQGWLKILEEVEIPLPQSYYTVDFLPQSCCPSLYYHYHPTDSQGKQKMKDLGDRTRKLFVEMGCIPHRTGRLWRPYIMDKIDSNYLKYIREIKKLFDPNNIMNPGVSVF